MRQALGCGVTLVADSSFRCSSGSFPAGSAAAALPRSFLPGAALFSGYLRVWPIAACAAMPILSCVRDQVTCTARAWQHVSGFGWRAVVGLERGNVGGSGRIVNMVQARRERRNEPPRGWRRLPLRMLAAPLHLTPHPPFS